MLNWWQRQHAAGLALVAAGSMLIGLNIAIATAGTLTPGTIAQTRTLHRTIVEHKTRLVTVRVRGKVIRRHDHVLVVLVPRSVFHTRTIPRHRIVVPKHVVRIHQPPPLFGEQSAVTVLGVAPPPVTVTVTEVVPGPVSTVTLPAETVTATSTETTVVPTTITVTVPLAPEGTP